MMFNITTSLPKEDVASLVQTCIAAANLTKDNKYFYDWDVCAEGFDHALITAAKRHDLASFRRLITNAPPGFSINTMTMAIIRLVNYIPVLEDVLLLPGTDVNTGLNVAVQFGKTSAVATLLKHPGIDPNTTDNDNWTPLHSAVTTDSVDIVSLLLAHRRTDVNAANAYTHKTALHYAVSHSTTRVMKVLLGHDGLDVRARDKKGKTPLHMAVGSTRITKINLLLADSRVDVNAADQYGFTPLHVTASFIEEHDVAVVAGLLLAAQGIDIEARTMTGQTPLHRAAFFDNVTLVNALLHAGADVNAVDMAGLTALDLARSNSSPRVQAILSAL